MEPVTDLWSQFQAFFSVEKLMEGVRAAILLLGGMVVARLVSRGVARLIGERMEAEQLMLLRRVISYGILILFAVAALHQLGFNLGVLLGAAGILSVAIGFASQTSASNIISGLFLIFERPFKVGDIVQVAGGTTGEVLSVDLMSVKLRTFDNRYVRVPNESMIKSEVTTLTRFPIRRVDVAVGVAYKEDVGRVREVLEEVGHRNPMVLEEPAPVFMFLGFGDSALQLQFSVWTLRENFVPLRTAIHREIKEALDAEGIEIPFPHRTIYTGSLTEAFPVHLARGDGEPPEPST